MTRQHLTRFLLVVGAWIAGSTPLTLEAQTRRQAGPPTLRVLPHEATYYGIFEVVSEIGEREQYRIGPDTLVLGVDVTGSGNDMTLAYALDMGDGNVSEGEVEISELGFEVAVHWRPALEMLTLLSMVPLTQDAKAEGEGWTEITSYMVPELDLEFGEATRFVIESIDGNRVTISFSAEGGGTTTVPRPQLGAGATMEVARESARQGHFVFDVEEGRVIESERIERITNASVFFVGDDANVGPQEVQTIRLRLVPAGG